MNETLPSPQTMVLPNVRKLFVPDPGYIIVDADLKGADVQVVAAEARDMDLLEAFRLGLDIHTKNATEMWGSSFTRLEPSAKRAKRQAFKSAVHATNYGAAARTLSLNPAIGFTVDEAEWFQKRWFTLHPGIKKWHQRTSYHLQANRTISNAFGYRIIYFDRIEALLPQALAWLPQSTVAEITFRGALQLEEACPFVEMLLQVHDSIVFQVPLTHWHEERIREIRENLIVPIPYNPPLSIKWKLSASPLSWGDCTEIKEAA
jgi:DNA polymerase-1